jgi:hypothetical protein
MMRLFDLFMGILIFIGIMILLAVSKQQAVLDDISLKLDEQIIMLERD